MSTTPRLILVASVAAIMVTASAASGQSAAPTTGGPEYTLDRSRGLVGSFGGYGGQLNQHVYAKISGPPPGSRRRGQGVALEPQLVRIFFNTSAMGERGSHGFVRQNGRARAPREGGDQRHVAGQHVRFAMRNMDRFADLLEPRRRRARSSTSGSRCSTNRTQRRERCRSTSRSTDSSNGICGARGMRDRIRFMGGDLIRLDGRRVAGGVVPLHGGEHGRSPRRVVGARLLGLLGHRQDRRTAPARGANDLQCDPCPTEAPPVRHRVRRPGHGGFEGESSFEPGFWPDGTPMSATNAAAFQQAWFNLRSAQLGYSGTVKWDVYPAKYDAGTQDHASLGSAAQGWPVRPVYRVLQLTALTTGRGAGASSS